jgi:hypothetical protein
MFVLVADLLQFIFNEANDLDLLKLPLQHKCGQDFPIIQYVDDTILIMEACPRQLFFLKVMLNSFTYSTGTEGELSQTQHLSHQCVCTKMEILLKTFNCQIDTFLFSYLGLPMGLIKLNLTVFTLLVQKNGCKLTSGLMFLSHAG